MSAKDIKIKNVAEDSANDDGQTSESEFVSKKTSLNSTTVVKKPTRGYSKSVKTDKKMEKKLVLDESELSLSNVDSGSEKPKNVPNELVEKSTKAEDFVRVEHKENPKHIKPDVVVVTREELSKEEGQHKKLFQEGLEPVESYKKHSKLDANNEDFVISKKSDIVKQESDVSETDLSSSTKDLESSSLPSDNAPAIVDSSATSYQGSDQNRGYDKNRNDRRSNNTGSQNRHKRDHRRDGSGQALPGGQSGTYNREQWVKKDINEMNLAELIQHSRKYGIIGAGLMNKADLIAKIKYYEANPDEEIFVEGVLEKLPDGFGFLRSPGYDYVSGPDDVYVSPSQIRRLGLRTGDTITGVIRKPKEGEKYFALLKIDKVNFDDPAKLIERPYFDRLAALHPDEKFNLEYDPEIISTRVLDIFSPIGKGQRGLIVAPPKAGKTVFLKDIAQSITHNHPDTYLIVLLIDERPEEVTEMKRFVKGKHAEVVSSTFDEAAERHVTVAETVLEKAKRLVESGKDVVILLDSITRLARAYNTVAPASGKVLTGGIDANALQKPKRFFGAARNTETTGSLTIIATALIETGSRMDEVIYEEFKGTGNMEIHMTRKLANRRVYPALDLLVSGTRRDDLLQTPEDLNKAWVLQKFLATMNTVEGMEFIIDKMKKFKTNEEFLDSMNKKESAGASSGTSSSSSSNGKN
ncbi:MAG: Transcription termination factor Rho [candidate division TM6 bacterium GW2011_GWF2_32_72]|nr:MAG: Transcription termination factor Rho [candidate division TM6 bacterium GW2011_GWF2_32_72]